MKARTAVRTVLASLCCLFLALFVASKVHFFTRYDPLRVGGYLQEHRIYWVAMAATAFLIWLIAKRFPQDGQ